MRADPYYTLAGPLAYYLYLTVPNGISKEELEATLMAKWDELGLRSDYRTGFCLTVQRNYALKTRVLNKTTAALFIYGCTEIMPHQGAALGKAIGCVDDKICIMQEPELQWFKMRLVHHKFWVLQPSRHEGWVEEPGQPPVSEPELEVWMQTTYPGMLPDVWTHVESYTCTDA